MTTNDEAGRAVDEAALSYLSFLLRIIDEADQDRSGQLWYPKGRSCDEQNWQAERNINQRETIEAARKFLRENNR